MTGNTPIEIDFDALVGIKPAALPSDQIAISKVITQTEGNITPLDVTRDLLSDAMRAKAREIALRDYKDLRDHRNIRGIYGNDALEPLNAVVDLFLGSRGKIDVGNIEPYLREMNDAVDNFRRKNDASDSEVIKKLRLIWGRTTKLVGELERFAKGLYVDSLAAQEQLDRVAGKLAKRQDQLEQNVEYCDLIIEKNEECCKRLIAYIAVMEQVIVLAHQEQIQLTTEIEALHVGSDLRRDLSLKRDKVDELVRDFEIRASAFTQRLAVAWTTTPLTKRAQTLSYDLAQRIGLLITLTIPVLKLVVSELALLAEAEKAGDTITRIDDATNKALLLLGTESVRVNDKASRLVETTALRPETILSVMGSVAEINANLLVVEAYGRDERAAMGRAVQQGRLGIQASLEHVQQARLAALAATQRPLELSAKPTVPEEVLQYAAQKGLAINV